MKTTIPTKRNIGTNKSSGFTKTWYQWHLFLNRRNLLRKSFMIYVRTDAKSQIVLRVRILQKPFYTNFNENTNTGNAGSYK